MKLRVYIDTSVVGGYFDDEFEDVTQLDVLVSWNFKHIVNYDKIKLFNSINLRLGYPMIEIRSPKEFVRYENND
ncbi:MAG: hypothetical protein M1445_12840 [Bacteroidetes bacterium]|nr:hypothetical protein [Bacteroidota bacterium]